jgi:putative ABC transport system permease protein
MWNGTIPAIANQHTGMRPYQLTMRDMADVAGLADVRGTTCELSRSDLYEVSQWANTSSHVIGTDTKYPGVRNVPILEGRFIDQADINERRRVAVLGFKTANLLFPGHPRLGDTITINGTAFTIIGAVDKIARGDFDFDDRKIYLPISTMLQLFPLKGGNIPDDALTSIQYQPAQKGEVDAAKAAVHRVIATNHGFDASMKDAFQEWDTITEMKLVGAIFTAMDIFLGGVGIVTLGLGAVGIINIMLVSVNERTSEIGLRKALGATKRSILTQFFWEGLLLTGVSGAIGIGGSALFMGVLQALLTGKMPGWDPPRLVPWSAAVSMLALVISGVAAGLYPASKAAQLDPVEALRREN